MSFGFCVLSLCVRWCDCFGIRYTIPVREQAAIAKPNNNCGKSCNNQSVIWKYLRLKMLMPTPINSKHLYWPTYCSENMEKSIHSKFPESCQEKKNDRPNKQQRIFFRTATVGRRNEYMNTSNFLLVCWCFFFLIQFETIIS